LIPDLAPAGGENLLGMTHISLSGTLATDVIINNVLIPPKLVGPHRVLTINEIAKPFLGREWRVGAGALGPKVYERIEF
jgi:hypothetical protein